MRRGSAGEAWNSLQVLNHQVTLGWFIRALHGWGSNFMVAIVLIHMAQVFLFGAYKFSERADPDRRRPSTRLNTRNGVHGPGAPVRSACLLGIGASIASRVPVLGPWIVKLLLKPHDEQTRHELGEAAHIDGIE
jgi:ubiquinol-cytochrome c reductase cytochrome b subunit